MISKRLLIVNGIYSHDLVQVDYIHRVLQKGYNKPNGPYTVFDTDPLCKFSDKIISISKIIPSLNYCVTKLMSSFITSPPTRRGVFIRGGTQ